ncbi:DUF4157 domain-containing protein [Neptunomonas sp.]|uniref:eCIS core domain-containing protein n=1 Tax=Neptunomonas sp. TaxID=1971898 RepID=UPI0035619833
MRTFAQKPKASQQAIPTKSRIPAGASLGQRREVNSILQLQRTLGNQVMQRMLQTNPEELEVGLASTVTPLFSHDFCRIPIHPPAEAIQTKLAINKPGDIYEQEADYITEQVMRMPEPEFQRACPCGGGCLKCRTARPGQKHERLQTKHVGLSDSGQTAAPPIVYEVLRSPGQPLDSMTRAFMEPRFKHDFGGVRVHTDSRAAESARAVSALAYTVGRNVVFGAGQHAPESRAGRRLLAHELTHVVQQAPLLQRQPDPEADKANVDACLKQTKDLLPGKVGLVEHINRGVLLDEAIGKERQSLEAQIRQKYDARKFVCEAGVPAMLALFYNRDYHNRLWVDRARESFTKHPEFYSSAGSDKVIKTKAFLTKKYRITLEPGDKAWSPEDIRLLAEALGKLTDSEIPLIADYRFIRWTNRCNQFIAANPNYKCELEDYGDCGLHLAEVVHRDYTITMYDCFKSDPDETAKKGYNVQPGADIIVHEIGHAIEFAKLRLALEKQGDAKREYQRLNKLADAATGNAKVSLNQQVAAAKKMLAEADKAVNDAMSPSVLDQFTALTKEKPALTPYSKKNTMEAFAEAFMLYKVAPDKLKKANEPLFNWFAKGGSI